MLWLNALITDEHTLDRDLELLRQADVVFFGWSAFIDKSNPSYKIGHAILRNLTKRHIVVLWVDVPTQLQEHWDLAYNIVRMVHETAVNGIVVLATPTDPNHRLWADELKVKVFQHFACMPYALVTPRLNAESITRKEAFFMFYDGLRMDKGQSVVEPLIGKVPIVVVGNRGLGWVSIGTVLSLQARSFSLLFPSQCDSCSRTLIAAGILEQIPIMLLSISAHWRTLTFGFNDLSLMRIVPIAKDEAEFQDIALSAFDDPEGFRAKWLPSWLRWFNGRRELWHPLDLWERWNDEIGIPQPGDLMHFSHIFWVTAEEIQALPDGPWKSVPWSLNAPKPRND